MELQKQKVRSTGWWSCCLYDMQLWLTFNKDVV